jgi:hypothetical protein
VKITAIILAHFKERENNLKRIVDDLLAGTVKPDEIVVFIDNQEINFTDSRVTVVRSSKLFLPRVRFALGSYFDGDYCFFIDDDLSVREKTLENFAKHAEEHPNAILGLEGSILGDTPTPYSNDTCITRGGRLLQVDIVIRTYFVPRIAVAVGLELQSMYPDFPSESLDDVYLCLGNKYLHGETNWVIPIDKTSDLIELDDGGVGQSRGGDHYKNRNLVCRKLKDIHE